MARKFATAAELARHLRVAEPTVRAWLRFTEIPVIRVGRLVRFDVDAVEAWYASGGPASLAPAMRADAERRRRARARAEAEV